jgi:hypothetical protein
MLLSTGNVLRDDTARPTMDNPLARFSCKQLTLTTASPGDFHVDRLDAELHIEYSTAMNAHQTFVSLMPNI